MAPLIIVSGPSASGKSTVVARLLREGGLPLRAAVSVTTRAPRPGEVDGVSYHFWTRERFQDEVAAGSFLEHAEVLSPPDQRDAIVGWLRELAGSR